MTRQIILLTAGIEGEWEPTEDDLAQLTDLFVKAANDPAGGVVAVRNGVDVQLIELTDPPKASRKKKATKVVAKAHKKKPRRNPPVA